MADAPPSTPWTCPSCGAAATAPFCGACGERRLHPGDLSLRHYAEAAAESLLSWDGRILGTLWTLMRRPGELTAAYLEGRRRPYLNPLQLFLVVNLLFFVMQGVTHWNTYSTPFGVHVNRSNYQELSRPLARWRMDQLGIAYEGAGIQAYARRFDANVQLNAKSLLILMVPFMSVLVAVARLGRPPRAAVHLTAGFHLTAALVLMQTVILPLASLVADTLRQRGTPVDSGALDFVVTWMLNLLMFAYAALAVRRAFGASRLAATASALAIAYLTMDVIQGYRLVLFVITLITTS